MIAKYLVIAWLVFGTLVVIGRIGKPRGPIAPGEAVLGVVFNTILIATIMIFWE